MGLPKPYIRLPKPYKLGIPHPTSLCDEPRFWWLGFLFNYPLLWSCFSQGKPFSRLCALYSRSPAASTPFAGKSRFVPASLPVGRVASWFATYKVEFLPAMAKTIPSRVGKNALLLLRGGSQVRPSL